MASRSSADKLKPLPPDPDRHHQHSAIPLRRGAPQRAAWDTFDEAHGRFVRRRVFASTEAASLEALRTWPNLHTVLAVESLRSTNGTPKVETEIRDFLSSCRDDPIVLGRAIRQHWAIENALHWVLDVTFREDDSRVRDQRAARNLAVLRRMAINLAQDGDQSCRTRWLNQGQCAGQAEKGRLGQRLHAPALGGVAPPPVGRGETHSC